MRAETSYCVISSCTCGLFTKGADVECLYRDVVALNYCLMRHQGDPAPDFPTRCIMHTHTPTQSHMPTHCACAHTPLTHTTPHTHTHSQTHLHACTTHTFAATCICTLTNTIHAPTQSPMRAHTHTPGDKIIPQSPPLFSVSKKLRHPSKQTMRHTASTLLKGWVLWANR